MNKNKLKCRQCKAQFYPANQAICGICDNPFCPNCSACACTLEVPLVSAKKIIINNIKDLNSIYDDQLIEITTNLSPLIGQTPIQTQQGVILKTEFEITDENQKIPLIIWGPVPEKLFPYRYEFTTLTISGLKKGIFKGKPILIASKETKYFINNLKTKSLEYFISESVS